MPGTPDGADTVGVPVVRTKDVFLGGQKWRKKIKNEIKNDCLAGSAAAVLAAALNCFLGS